MGENVMVDYDGQDAIITYLNGLAWTALTEPTYLKYFDQKSSEEPNVLIVNLVSITPARLNKDEYILNHHLVLQYVGNTKANSWPNFKYILTNLWKLTDANSHYEVSNDISVTYTKDRKIFGIPVFYSEIISM